MASQTHFECDGCGRDIQDPGQMFDVDITLYEVADGDRTYKHPSGPNYELCGSCGNDVKNAINRVLARPK